MTRRQERRPEPYIYLQAKLWMIPVQKERQIQILNPSNDFSRKFKVNSLDQN